MGMRQSNEDDSAYVGADAHIGPPDPHPIGWLGPVHIDLLHTASLVPNGRMWACAPTEASSILLLPNCLCHPMPNKTNTQQRAANDIKQQNDA